MHEFAYLRPHGIAEAVAMFADAEDARYLAGGQSLVPLLKHRLAQPTHLVDVGRIAELAGIAVEDGAVVIGGGVRHAAVAADPAVRRVLPALAAVAAGIGDRAVRSLGTLGGALAHNDPAGDYPAAVLGLGAEIRTDRRRIAADDFFTGLFETALEAGEIVTAVAFPVPARAAYVKIASPASRFAVAGSFVADFDGAARVAITGAGPVAFRATAFEEALRHAVRPERLEGLDWPADGLNADLHASPDYRAALVGVATRRAVRALG